MKDLLIIAYWWHAALRPRAPEWVRKHPMWPENNDDFHVASAKGPLSTAVAGRDRLWEAIAAEFKVDLFATGSTGGTTGKPARSARRKK